MPCCSLTVANQISSFVVFWAHPATYALAASGTVDWDTQHGAADRHGTANRHGSADSYLWRGGSQDPFCWRQGCCWSPYPIPCYVFLPDVNCCLLESYVWIITGRGSPIFLGFQVIWLVCCVVSFPSQIHHSALPPKIFLRLLEYYGHLLKPGKPVIVAFF